MSQKLIRDCEEISILICLSPWALSPDEIKLGREKVSCEGKQSTQEAGLQDKQQWLAGYWRIRMTKCQRMHVLRIVDGHNYSRGVGMFVAEMFSPPKQKDDRNFCQGLTQPHIGLATVVWTGTRPPLSHGRKPNAAGQSVMSLPGTSLPFAIHGNMYDWPIRAAINGHECRATIVVRDGSTDHMAKGCRLGWFLKSNTLGITQCR